MNHKQKQWMLIAVGTLACALLVGLIYNQSQKDVPTDTLPTVEEPTTQVEVVVPDTEIPDTDEVEIEVPPIQMPEINSSVGVDSGTEQTIQADVEKPTYTEEELTNPEQTPNGIPVEPPTEENPEPAPVENQVPATVPDSGGEAGQVYLPGFGWVTPSESVSVEVDGDGDINTQVGTMG